MTTSDGTNDPDAVIDKHDTPTERVAINRLSVDELDSWLDAIRQRRLLAVKKLEATAKVKSDEVRLEAFLRFQRAYDRAKKAIQRLDEMEVKVEAAVHKCRLMALAAELEVTMEHEDATTD